MRLQEVTSPPSVDELADRLAKVRGRMEMQELDFYVSFDSVNIYYLTNFYNYVHERPFVLVIPIAGDMRFVVPQLEESHVLSRALAPLEVIRYFEYPAPDGERWNDRFRALIPPTARVGVESAITLRIYERTPGTRVRTDIIDEVRLVKTEYEIGRTVHACRIMNDGFRRLLEVSRPGRLVTEVSGEVVSEMLAAVAADIPHFNHNTTKCDALIHPPSMAHDPHNFSDLYLRLEAGGPHVSIVAGQVDGYGVELERTFFFDEVPEPARAPFDAMMEGRAFAFDRARPGTVLEDIDAGVRAILRRGGYEGNLLHRTGHGLGITGHEAPYLALGDQRTLEPGMLISIEPGIYIPGTGGFRHSDTILITQDGNLCLTEAPDRLEDLTIAT